MSAHSPAVSPRRIRCLVAVDMSTASLKAFQEAVNLVKCDSRFERRIFILSVLVSGISLSNATIPSNANCNDQEMEKRYTELQEIAEYAIKQKIPANLIVARAQKAGEEIINQAHKRQIDLIVLSATGSGESTRLGSNVEYVIKYSSANIKIVR